MLRVVWATHYLRWAAILGTTAGAHVLAFLIAFGDGGGNGPAVPKGRVTLHFAQTEPPSVTPTTPMRISEPPVVSRLLPVEIPRSATPSGSIPFAAPVGAASAQPSATGPSLPYAVSRSEAPAAPCVREPLRRAGAELREIDAPLGLDDRVTVPGLVFAAQADGSETGIRSSGGAVANRGGTGGAPGSAASGEGVEPDFVLSGKPVYPAECRRGECNGRHPCEGVSRWRVTVPTPGGKPSRIERIQSAGCERLDASTEAFLREARVPRAGVFLLRFRFKLDGSR